MTKTESDTTKQNVPYSTVFTTRTITYTWANSLLASQQGPVKELTKYTYDSTGAVTIMANALRVGDHLIERLA